MATDDSGGSGLIVARTTGRYAVIAAVAGAAVATMGVLVGPLGGHDSPTSTGKIRYFIQYQNTATARADNVILRVRLPDHMEYVPGTTILGWTKHPNGQQISDDITLDGVNIGSWAPGGGGWVRFTAEVTNGEDRPCTSEDLRVEIGSTPYGGDTSPRSALQVWAEC